MTPKRFLTFSRLSGLFLLLCSVCVLLYSSSANAISVVYNKFGVYYSNRIDNQQISDCTNYIYREDLGWNADFSACALNRVLVETTGVTATSDQWSVQGSFNIVAYKSLSPTGPIGAQFVNKNQFNIIGATLGGSGVTVENTSLQTYITDWTKDGNRPMQTFTVQFSMSGKGAAGKTGSFRIMFGNPDYAFFYSSFLTANATLYFEPNNQNLQVNFANSENSELLQQQIDQNNVIINQNTENTQAIYENTRAIYENTRELYKQGDELEEQTEIQQETLDYITDDTEPDVDTSVLSGSAGWLPPGPVDSILTLPINFIQAIIQALTSSNCYPVILPLPYVNRDITLPCMRPILNEMGFGTIYEAIGSVVALFIIWENLKWLYEFVDKTLTFREDNSSIWGGL